MTTLSIPPLGTTLKLARDWTFALYDEHRNAGLFKALKIKPLRDEKGLWRRDLNVPITLPAGTELIIRRYYIRLGQQDFDSITFSAKIGKKSHRFWVKLADANSIEYEEPTNG